MYQHTCSSTDFTQGRAGQTDRQAGRQTDRQAGRQAGRERRSKSSAASECKARAGGSRLKFPFLFYAPFLELRVLASLRFVSSLFSLGGIYPKPPGTLFTARRFADHVGEKEAERERERESESESEQKKHPGRTRRANRKSGEREGEREGRSARVRSGIV